MVRPNNPTIKVVETVKNLTGVQRAVGRAQHVTIGAHYLQAGWPSMKERKKERRKERESEREKKKKRKKKRRRRKTFGKNPQESRGNNEK